MSAPSLHLVHTTQAQPVQRDRLIRLPDVLRIVGLGKSTVYGLMSRGEFPRCVQVTPRCVGWSEAACHAWVQARLAEATNKAAASPQQPQGGLQ